MFGKTKEFTRWGFGVLRIGSAAEFSIIVDSSDTAEVNGEDGCRDFVGSFLFFSGKWADGVA